MIPILIILGVLLIGTLLSTGWLFAKFGALLGSLGLVGWIVVIVILYFVLRKFTPFGALIDQIIGKFLTLIKAGNQLVLIGGIVLFGFIGLSYFGMLSIIDGWNVCTTEKVEYAGMVWEVEGCPLGQAKHTERASIENDQGYGFKDSELYLWSKTTGGSLATPERVMITLRATMPEDKKITVKSKLFTTAGNSKIFIFDGIERIYYKERGSFKVGTLTPEHKLLPEERNKYDCGSSPPNNPYQRYSYNICWIKNTPTEDVKEVEIKAGRQLKIILESWAEQSSVGEVEAWIYTTRVNVPIGENLLSGTPTDSEVSENVQTNIENLGSSVNSFFDWIFGLLSKLIFWD